MKTKNVGLLIAFTMAALSFAPAAYACAEGEDQTGCEPPADTKGNNGWGNGADSTNAGSDDGGTAGTKEPNGYGEGKGPTKFTTR